MSIALSIVLVLLVVPAALIDLEHRIIPNKLTGLGAILAVAMGTALDTSGEPGRLIAGIAAGGFLLLAALAYPGDMGMGDVKLAGMMGLFLGVPMAVAILVALLAGTLAGAMIVVRAGAKPSEVVIPFGPFLALGSLVAIFWGQAIVNAYLNHFLR
jgi:leader peptidase (prepilin peptidase)/N-methyltransferase